MAAGGRWGFVCFVFLIRNVSLFKRQRKKSFQEGQERDPRLSPPRSSTSPPPAILPHSPRLPPAPLPTAPGLQSPGATGSVSRCLLTAMAPSLKWPTMVSTALTPALALLGSPASLPGSRGLCSDWPEKQCAPLPPPTCARRWGGPRRRAAIALADARWAAHVTLPKPVRGLVAGWRGLGARH